MPTAMLTLQALIPPAIGGLLKRQGRLAAKITTATTAPMTQIQARSDGTRCTGLPAANIPLFINRHRVAFALY